MPRRLEQEKARLRRPPIGRAEPGAFGGEEADSKEFGGWGKKKILNTISCENWGEG